MRTEVETLGVCSVRKSSSIICSQYSPNADRRWPHRSRAYEFVVRKGLKMNGATAALIPLIACLTASLILCDRCCQINSRQLPQYKLVRSNARSTQLILSRRTVRNLNECKAFALAKKALAFNYGLETDPSGKVKI